jgi:hypothetical protein
LGAAGAGCTTAGVAGQSPDLYPIDENCRVGKAKPVKRTAKAAFHRLVGRFTNPDATAG